MSIHTNFETNEPRNKAVSSKVSYQRVVVKVGTTLLTHGADKLDLQVMATLVEQIAQLHLSGTEVMLVSSGAVAAGRHVLGIPPETKEIPYRQVLAAAGQGRLMHAYEQLFDWRQIPVAQALLSRKDFIDRLGYLNIRNTLLALLELRVIPIVNENDVVAIDEIDGDVFGDNDNLSALVANLIDADLLILLGQVDGLFTADPNIDPTAHLIPIVSHLDQKIESIAGDSWGKQGQGGMTTKIEAARLATTSGTNVVIANGLEPNILARLTIGEHIGTLFPATSSKMESRKRWMLSKSSGTGKIIVDEGATHVLRDENRSLLSPGIKGIVGTFQRGDVVSVVEHDHAEIAIGIVNYNSDELNIIKGAHSDEIKTKLGHQYGDEVMHRNNMVSL